MEQGVNRLPATIESRFPDDPGTQPTRVTIEVKRDLDLLPEDAAALDSLIASRPEVGVFLSRAWLSGFFVEPPRGFEPLLVLLRHGSDLCGIAPIAVRDTLTHVRVRLLGGGVGSDRVDLLTSPGFETSCSDAFMSWLAQAFEEQAFVLEFRDVPAESPLWGAVSRANAERTLRLALQPRELHTLPYLDLDLAGSRSRLADRPSVPRCSRSLDRHRRWLDRRGRLRIEALQEPDAVLAAFESLTEFLHVRWDGTGSGSALDRPGVRRFHRHVIPLLLAEGRLKMIRLSSDMRTIAVFYGLVSGRWWGYYLAGFDRQWAGRIHLGQLTLATAIDLACREGATEFDFLKGVERVKYMWPVRERRSVDADVYSHGAGSQFMRAVCATGEAVRGFIKSARAL
jgi:CelD/BcsL family acetyltransferase involved in cellulose biosynthesis